MNRLGKVLASGVAGGTVLLIGASLADSPEITPEGIEVCVGAIERDGLEEQIARLPEECTGPEMRAFEPAIDEKSAKAIIPSVIEFRDEANALRQSDEDSKTLRVGASIATAALAAGWAYRSMSKPQAASTQE